MSNGEQLIDLGDIIPLDNLNDFIWDVAGDLGIDGILRRLNGESEPSGATTTTDKNQLKPDFWSENKKWLLPTLVVGGIGMVAIVTAKSVGGTRVKLPNATS